MIQQLNTFSKLYSVDINVNHHVEMFAMRDKHIVEVLYLHQIILVILKLRFINTSSKYCK